MTRRIVIAFMAAVALLIPVLVIPLGVSFSKREELVLTAAVERDARTIATSVGRDLKSNPERAQSVADAYRSRTGGRVLIVDAEATSIVDSDDAPGRSFGSRAEIRTALDGDSASGTRPSQTAGTDLIFVAVPIVGADGVIGAARITYPRAELDHRIKDNWVNLIVMSALSLAAAGLCGAALAAWATRPLRSIEAAAGQLRDGDLTARAPENAGPIEVRRLSSTFNGMAERTSEVMEAQRDFVADASHQLRTPLTALSLRLEAIEDRADEATGPDVTAAIAEVARLGRIVNQLLALTRSEAAIDASQTQDLIAIVDDRLAAWAAAASKEGIRLATAPADGLGPGHFEDALFVTAPDGAIEQILDNLIRNALNAFARPGFRSEGEAVITVTCRRVPAGRTDDTSAIIAMTVADSGPGMTDQQLERCFDRFWRAPDAIPGGSGLGLAIVGSLARACEGTAAAARSELGGCAMTIEFKESADEAALPN